jgi:hypothetical protein
MITTTAFSLDQMEMWCNNKRSSIYHKKQKHKKQKNKNTKNKKQKTKNTLTLHVSRSG